MKMRDSQANGNRPKAGFRINLDWRLAIARASGNEPLTALMEAISTPIRDAQDYRRVTTPDLRAAAVKAHAVILKAIADQDGDAAFEPMERHVTAYREVATKPEAIRKAVVA